MGIETGPSANSAPESKRAEVTQETKMNVRALHEKMITEKNPWLETQVQTVDAVAAFLPVTDKPLTWRRLSMPRTPTDGMFLGLPPSLYVRYDDVSQKWQLQWVKDMVADPTDEGWQLAEAGAVPSRWTAGPSDIKMVKMLSAFNDQRKQEAVDRAIGTGAAYEKPSTKEALHNEQEQQLRLLGRKSGDNYEFGLLSGIVPYVECFARFDAVSNQWLCAERGSKEWKMPEKTELSASTSDDTRGVVKLLATFNASLSKLDK